MPRTGPPAPTSGPFPPSSVGLAVVGTGAGMVVGIDFGATTCIARDCAGRPSPPTRPTVGLVLGCPTRTNPTRSCGTAARLSEVGNSPFRISMRMKAIATTTCTPSDTRKGVDSLFLVASVCDATRRKIIRRAPSLVALPDAQRFGSLRPIVPASASTRAQRELRLHAVARGT